jgi:hypothetical protein
MNAEQIQQVAGLVLQEVVKQLPTLMNQSQINQPTNNVIQETDAHEDLEMDPTEGSEEECGDISWSRIVQPRTTTPDSKDVKDFIQLLQSAPPLQDLKHQTSHLPRFTGVPEPPPPRRANKVDQHLHNVESKLCVSMNILANYLETKDNSNIGLAAAYIRSAQQDVREQRRALMAGKQAWKLDPRVDDEKPKLLNAEEEKRINFRGKGKGKGKGGWQSTSWFGNNNENQRFQQQQSQSTSWNSWRGRSKSREPRGKGKGRRQTSEQK